MKVMDWVASWPPWGWYVAVPVWTAALAVISAGLYALAHGNFWDPFLWGMAVAVPLQWLRLWWYDRERARKAS